MFKKFLIIVTALLTAATMGCTPNVKTAKNQKQHKISIEQSHEIPGYIRLSFDESEPATEMVKVSCYDSPSILIDTNGKVVCPPIYDYVSDSSEGYSIVGRSSETDDTTYCDPFGNLLNVKRYAYTYVNIKGEECFGYYSNATDFSEGIAFVQGAEDNWYALDKNGTLTKLDKSISWVFPFSDGLAKFYNEDDNIGYINHNFEIVIPAIYSDADDFSEGLAAVSAPDERLIYIDKDGNTVIETDYKYYDVSWNTMRINLIDNGDSHLFQEDLALISSYDNTVEYIDKNGNTVMEDIYGGSFSHGLAPAIAENGNVGFIDKTGTFVIPAQYYSASSFNEYGTAFVYSHEFIPYELNYTYYDFYEYYCGCINTKGEIVIPLEYYCDNYMYGLPDTTNGIFKLHKDGYVHYFKSDGTLIGKIEAAKGAAELYESLKQSH